MLSIGVIIATRNRPGPLGVTLDTLAVQTLLPDITVIVDSSDTGRTEEMIRSTRWPGLKRTYLHVPRPSAARQRNLGVSAASTDLVVFLDDDVELDPEFLDQVRSVFALDETGEIAGVSGTMTNQSYTHPRLLNRILLRICTGYLGDSFAGRLVGPAVNFLPADGPHSESRVDWLVSGCTAYRKHVFDQYRFEDTFEGYSFAEDVHLSARVAQRYTLINTTRARLYHHDLGGSTHTDWSALGESMVRNRHLIMFDVLGRTSLVDHVQLFCFEIVYGSAAWLAAGRSRDRLTRLAQLMKGKLRGFRDLRRKRLTVSHVR